MKADRIAEFLEFHAPMVELRRWRETGSVDDQIANFRRQAERRQRLIRLFERLDSTTPRMQHENTFAVYEFRLPDETPLDPRLPAVNRPSMSSEQSIESFAGDIHSVLRQAGKVLAENRMDEFVAKLFPASLFATDSDGLQVRELVQSLRESPQWKQQMLADLNAMRTAEPQLLENGRLARFELPDRPPIVMQKHAGSWRFFDHRATLQQEVYEQASRGLLPDVIVLEFERVGSTWRLTFFPD